MTSLRDIRQKIHTAENIKKITQAMERVAAVHLRRAQKKAEQSAPYAKKIKELLDQLVVHKVKNPLFDQKTVKKTGLVVIAADKGLSGNYNTNILNATDNFLKKYEPKNIELLIIGKKAFEHYRRSKWKIFHQIEEWGGKITHEEIKSFSSQLVNWFLDTTFDEIWLIHTHYVSIMKRTIVVEKFLNIVTTSSENTKHLNYILEPCGAEILEEILPRYISTRIQTALDESYAAELAARIVAMQAATKNSEEMIERLELAKNKRRQRDITREMIEISNGANA